MRPPAPRSALVTLAVTFLAVVSLFAWYADNRQNVADRRNERQRQAICAILANIPGKVPAEISNARVVFARPGHPRDCQPLHPTSEPPVTVRETNRNGKTRTVTIVVVPQQSTAAGSQPPASPSPSPKPSHTPKPQPKPTTKPTPSPSPSCGLRHPLRCL